MPRSSRTYGARRAQLLRRLVQPREARLPFRFGRVLPTGTADVIFRGDDWHVLHGVITGPRSRYVTVSTKQPFASIGVHFNPGAYPFVGNATVDLADASAPLGDLWGRAAHELSERFAGMVTPEDRFRVLEHALLARLPGAFVPRHPIRRALDLFQRSSGLMSVADIVERVGLSRRRFVDDFRSEVGLSPKAFCRLRRFSAVLDLISSLKDKNIDWADVAHTVGYTRRSWRSLIRPAGSGPLDSIGAKKRAGLKNKTRPTNLRTHEPTNPRTYEPTNLRTLLEP